VLEPSSQNLCHPLKYRDISLSLVCAEPTVKYYITQLLSSIGVRVVHNAPTQIFIDIKSSFVIQALECIQCDKIRCIVITWNLCPEYLEDLRDLEPSILITAEYFSGLNLMNAISSILEKLSDNRRYQFLPGTRTPLTKSERSVLRYVARGWDNKTICETLHLTEQTVKNYLRAIYRKLALQNRNLLILYYWHIM